MVGKEPRTKRVKQTCCMDLGLGLLSLLSLGRALRVKSGLDSASDPTSARQPESLQPPISFSARPARAYSQAQSCHSPTWSIWKIPRRAPSLSISSGTLVGLGSAVDLTPFARLLLHSSSPSPLPAHYELVPSLQTHHIDPESRRIPTTVFWPISPSQVPTQAGLVGRSRVV